MELLYPMSLLTSQQLNHLPITTPEEVHPKPWMIMITHSHILSVGRVSINGGKLISKTHSPFLAWRLLTVKIAAAADYMIMISSSWIRT